MSGNFDSEQWQIFNERLSHWISKQGFWFQLRHSVSGGGLERRFMFHFVHLLSRLVIFSILVGLVWVWVVKKTGMEKYSDTVEEIFKEKCGAKEIEIRGVSRESGRFKISRLLMIANQDSFFTGLDLSNLVCRRNFFVDFGQSWQPGIVEIAKMNLTLRSGADTDEGAQEIGDVLFQDLGGLQPDAIHVLNMSMEWGYSDHDRGSINASQMKAIPILDGWRLSFRGGTFSQNWLKNLKIEKLDVVITREGIRFEEANFSKGGGSLVFEEFKVVAGQRPEVSGKMKMKGMDVSSMLPVVARAYAEAIISGEFVISGSTNTSEGIGFEGDVALKEGDVITLREKIPLLRALTVVDANHDYRQVEFKVGSFQLEMNDKGVTFSNVKLFADAKISVEGEMIVRKPKMDEKLVLDDGSDFFTEINKIDERGDDVNISLRKVGEEVYGKNKGFSKGADEALFGKLTTLGNNRRITEYEAAKLSQSYRYEGEFKITLMGTAFDRAPALKAFYPATSDLGRIPITVPIKGVLYEVTANLAKTIYEKGRR